jgi:hypothetical protein
MSPKIVLCGISKNKYKLSVSISNKMCATTRHYTVFVIFKQKIENVFTLVGWDGAPMDHISSKDNLEDRKGGQLEIGLAHSNTRMTRLDDLQTGKGKQ